jgi:4-hydroxybenzoate polyprenyltransferase
MYRSLVLSRVIHALSVACFLALAWLQVFPVRWLFALAIGFMAALLMYEHAVVRPRAGEPLDIKHIDRAFFRVNIIVSMSFFVLTLLDRLLLA